MADRFNPWFHRWLADGHQQELSQKVSWTSSNSVGLSWKTMQGSALLDSLVCFVLLDFHQSALRRSALPASHAVFVLVAFRQSALQGTALLASLVRSVLLALRWSAIWGAAVSASFAHSVLPAFQKHKLGASPVGFSCALCGAVAGREPVQSAWLQYPAPTPTPSRSVTIAEFGCFWRLFLTKIQQVYQAKYPNMHVVVKPVK